MSEEIEDIIEDFETNINRLQDKIINYINNRDFCIKHGFNEEVRIMRLKLEEIEMVEFRFREILKRLKDNI